MGVVAGVISLDPRSPDPRAPLGVSSPDGRWRLFWSGRLDNRDEFRSRFGLDWSLGDAELAAGALARDGITSLGHAVGDFVAAAWDARDATLWLARDAIGFRPLFYRHARDHVWFSTELRWFIREAACERPINEGYIAEFLAGTVVSVHETPIDGVQRVLPGEALGFSFARAEPKRMHLWRPPTVMPPRRSDADLIAEFRARFTAAVARSTAGQARVCTQLSGGLDSTAVTAAVTSLTGTPPDAYSLVYPGMPMDRSGERLDESPFIDAAVAAIGCRSVRYAPLGAEGMGRDDVLRVTLAHGDLPDFPVTDALNYALFARAAADGHHVMLTGLGGDYWLTGSLSRLPALIRRGRWLEAWQFHRAARLRDTIGATTRQIQAHLLARLTPEWIKRIYRRAVRAADVWPPWLPAAFTDRVDLGARLRQLSARAPRADDFVLQDSLLTLTNTGGLLARESLFRAATDASIDVRHPMLDRDLVEFLITLPDDLRLRGSETRYILRRALADLLPPMILTRRDKGDATIVIAAAIAQLIGGHASFGERSAARGWIDPDVLWPRLRPLAESDYRARMPAEGDDHLWFAVAVETWLAARGA